MSDFNQEKMSKEWDVKKKYNPFNSYKLLAHIDRWKNIKKGSLLPPPVLVTIDPANSCNLKCIWCNSKKIINQNANFLSKNALEEIIKILQNWKSTEKKYKVEAVCIAGGGEPLMNPNINILINGLVDSGIGVGVVTNGTLIHKFIKSLSRCHWISVSIDCGTVKTFSKLKKTSSKQFNKIIENLKLLISYSKKNKTSLSNSSLSHGVTYKFLLHKDNIHEIEKAAKIAKKIGCRSIHIRPIGRPWYEKKEIVFKDKHIKMFYDQISLARKLEDKNFSIYGITHKFNSHFQPNNNFSKCHALFMTTVFMPPRPGDLIDSFVLSQCCDRRGDLNMELANNLINLDDVNKNWGNKHHWRIMDKLNLMQCPRCTYPPHNEIFEKVINQDNMSINFI